MLTTTQRHRRIERRASPEVLEAYRDGRITSRRADILLHLPAAEQKAELDRRLSEAHRHEARNRLVASIIRKYLDGLNGEKVDLHQLGVIIKSALAS
jgi:hypothetical protein